MNIDAIKSALGIGTASMQEKALALQELPKDLLDKVSGAGKFVKVEFRKRF